MPERKLARDRNGASSRDDGEVCEARGAKPVLQRRPVRQMKPARAVEQRAARACFGYHEAEIRPSREAVAAGPAGRDEAECDVISRADVHDAVPDRLDHARALVAQHGGPATRPQVAVGEPHVGVAHTDGRDPNEDLIYLGWIELDLLDRDRMTGLAQNCRADAHQPTR